MSQLENRDIVVTGAAGALGASLVTTFAALGARVHGLDRMTPREPVDSVDYAAVDLLTDS